jgi:GNAT superfamily N-acetyltransferase
VTLDTHADLVVRGVAREDLEQWLPLWDGYNAFYGRSGATALSREISASTWERFFDPAETVRALVAESGDRIVGIAHYLFHRSTIHIAPICYLQDLFTTAQMRGKGVASALIEAVRERAVAAGSTRLYWQTHETNAVARRLYDQLAERSGFIVYRKNC